MLSASNALRPTVPKFSVANEISEDTSLKYHADQDDLGVPVKLSLMGVRSDFEEAQMPETVEAMQADQLLKADIETSAFQSQSGFSQSFPLQSRESPAPAPNLHGPPLDEARGSDSIQTKRRKNDISRDSSKQSRKKKAKKGKGDEIDEIFGFL